MLEVNDFDAIQIALASPEQISSWSYGEVTKPETINYRTLKPERDGLFCERIFGPTKDYECFCGKYKKIRYKGVICDKCGVEVTQARVRRERMGHISLASPVAHIWFARGIPSRIGLLLNLSPRNLERVLYFSHYIVTSVNEAAKQEEVKKLTDGRADNFAAKQSVVESEIAEMEQKGASVEEVNQVRRNLDEERTKMDEEATKNLDMLRHLEKCQILTESEYQDLEVKYGSMFEAGMGAEAILDIIKSVNLDELRSQLIEEVQSTSGQRRKKASKQLRLVEFFRHSGNKPEWMILTILPVLPPDLRPLVQLDGGRLATSDLNDLYRRVINRNNRLRHLLDIGAPEIIIRNEKRMLQEAVDSLIDNGKRGKAVSVSGNHKLKSLSDILHGKQGRFRQNLLGKRVDYSGRSVIVVGPDLKLNQCGLPKQMALELFKPFVMRHLVRQGLAHNIKSARRLVERAKPEVYDMLEEVIKSWPVLLNRAPTLHRLGIQAFEPILIDDSAIQIHPLVCSAFNADFDGDQMAVHVPLSRDAVKEAKEVMLSIHNMLIPSSGDPVVSPTLDMVMGCFYLTNIKKGARGEGMMVGRFEDAKLLHELGIIDLGAEIEVRDDKGQRIKTSVGRIIFNDILPSELRFINKAIGKSDLKSIVAECYNQLSHEDTAKVLDSIKRLGFKYATRSGTTIAVNDIEVPPAKVKILQEAEERINILESQYRKGLITEDERYTSVVSVWMETTEKITDVISRSLDRYGGIYMMATSGAKGNITQIRQMAGMRGLMTDPSGRIIDFPIKSSLREGHSVLEYFISTHGARKGLADTALRTSDSGYLTRRLIDAAQDVIIFEEDCGTSDGVWVTESTDRGVLPGLQERITGRFAAAKVVNPETGEVIVDRNEMIDEGIAQKIIDLKVKQVFTRSPLSCQSRHGVCQRCYGRDLATRTAVEMNTAVGTIAAQSIGEPGTQLTLRTFHTGGVVGLDITSGLPRVEELFEARMPKSPAVVSEIDGEAEVIQDESGRRVKVISTEIFQDEYNIPEGWQLEVENGQRVAIGATLAGPPRSTEAGEISTEFQPVLARVSGNVNISGGRLTIRYEEREEREYTASSAAHILVQTGEKVKAGQQLTEGTINPQDLLHIVGRDAVQRYLVNEVQMVYRSQGVNINDKHIEIIVHQMLSKVRIDSSGDTDLVPGELIDRHNYEDTNAKVLAEGGEPATAQTVLLGVTRASLNTDSWLAAASFQETTRVLTEAAISSKVDRLAGLKENVIIGKLIPARHKLSEIPIESAPLAAVPAGNIATAIAEQNSDLGLASSFEDNFEDNNENDTEVEEDMVSEEEHPEEDVESEEA